MMKDPKLINNLRAEHDALHQIMDQEITILQPTFSQQRDAFSSTTGRSDNSAQRTTLPQQHTED